MTKSFWLGCAVIPRQGCCRLGNLLNNQNSEYLLTAEVAGDKNIS